MSFAESPCFTNGGREVQLKALSGEPLIFTSVRLGDGTMTGTISAKTALINERVSVNVNTVSANSEYATIDAIFKNADLSSGFYWKELGVFVANPDAPNDRNADILYAYQNVGNLAEYIPAPASALIEKILHIPVFIGDVDTVSIAVNSIVQQEATVTQSEATSISEEDYISFYDFSDAKNKKILFSDLKSIINTVTVEDISDRFATDVSNGLIEEINTYVHKQGNVISGNIRLSGDFSATEENYGILTLLQVNEKYRPYIKGLRGHYVNIVATKIGGMCESFYYGSIDSFFCVTAADGFDATQLLISFTYLCKDEESTATT